MSKQLITHIIEPSKDINCVTIISSDYHSEVSTDIKTILDYFYLNYNDKLNVVWDLDASVASLLILVKNKALLSKLKAQGKCYIPPYSIFYVPGRVFSIKPVTNSKTTILYNLSQYYPDLAPPTNLDELTRLGEKLLEALKTMRLEVNKLTSPVAVFEDNRLKYMNLPTVYDLPMIVAKYAAECAGKLWTEAYKVGFWKEAYDYDIDSSFPTMIKTLYDTRFGKWHRVKDALSHYYGFYHCKVTIYDNVKVSPIIYTDNKGNLSTPTGTWQTYLTNKEIQFIYAYKIGEVSIIDGYEWYPQSFATRNFPLMQTISDLLLYKESNNSLIRELAKRISVGIYGKFGEEHTDKFGRFYNPVWFAAISTNVRLEVAKFIYDNNLQDNLIHVSVDGVLVDKEVKI